MTPPPLQPQRRGARLGRTGPHATARPGTNQYPLQHRLAAATDGRCRTLGAWLCLGCIWPYLLPVQSRPANAHTNPCGLGIPAYYLGTKKTQCGFHRAESDGTYGRCSVRLTTENQQGEVDQPIHTQRLLQTDALGSRRKSTNKHSAHVCLETGPLCIFTYRPKRSHGHLPTCPPTYMPTYLPTHFHVHPPAAYLPPILRVETRASRAEQSRAVAPLPSAQTCLAQ